MDRKPDPGALGFGTPRAAGTGRGFKYSRGGFADVLGLSDFVTDTVQRSDLVKAYNDIRSCVRQPEYWAFEHFFSCLAGLNPDGGRPVFRVIPASSHLYMISDSVFFVLVPESKTEFTSMLDLADYGVTAIRLMSRTLSVCWKYNLPARGAISDGQVYYDSDQNVFIGEPMVKAVKWEKTQSFAWFTVEPTSAMVKIVSDHPTNNIAKVSNSLCIRPQMFEVNKLREYRLRWDYSDSLPLTSPQEFILRSQQEPDTPAYPLVLCPEEIQSTIDLRERSDDQRVKTIWRNTRELFEDMGVLWSTGKLDPVRKAETR